MSDLNKYQNRAIRNVKSSFIFFFISKKHKYKDNVHKIKINKSERKREKEREKKAQKIGRIKCRLLHLVIVMF